MPVLRERRDQRNDTGAGWYFFWLRDGQWPSTQQLLRSALSGEHAVGFARQHANLPIDKRKAAYDAMPDVKKKGSAKPSPQIGEPRPQNKAKEPVLSEDKPERASNPIFDQLKIAEVMCAGSISTATPRR